MDVAHIFTFLWAVINNWAGYATGGLIMAIIFLGQTLSKKWAPSKRLLEQCCVIFLVLAVFQAWDEQYTSATTARNSLNDKAPKLTGVVHRFTIADEPGTANSLIFEDVSVNNSGGMPSVAEDFGLGVYFSKRSFANAEVLTFSNEFKLPFFEKGKQWMLDLKRPQLISEKTIKAIPVGESPRGWAAFRLRGIPLSQFKHTNIVLSFLNVAGTRVFVTNGYWQGKWQNFGPIDDLTAVIPGAENIFYPIEPPARTTWSPPELPAGCSNVVVCFGNQGMILSRELAEISTTGKKFAISELPDFLSKSLDRFPPRQRDVWFRASPTKITIGGRTIDYPIQPVIISNRLFIEVEVPFSNEKRKLVMSDAFSAELPIPQNWDVNFSTNYDAYGNGIYAYEVVNELTNPVLQVGYLAPNEVHINGIFQVDSNSILAAFEDQPILGTFTYGTLDTNRGLMTASLQVENFHETLIIHSNETIASFGQRFTNEFFRPIFKHQRPIFKYPSNRNLGVFADALQAEQK